MILKCKSMLLVWALAFLQCLAPLLHAHAGGLHVSGGAHIHFEGLRIGALHAGHEIHADHAEMPSVGTPAEFRRDRFFSGDDVAVAAVALPLPAMPPTVFLPALSFRYFPVFDKPSPPAQAPPVNS